MRDLNLINKLDESSKSTLQRNIIQLKKYEKKQLIDILNERILMGFNLYSVNEDIISSIAELGFSKSGNARFAINLLWKAGKYADVNDKDVITAECVREAVSNTIPSVRRNELIALSLHEKLFLLALARFFKYDDNVYILLSEIEELYAVVCEEYNEEPNSHTQIWKYSKLLSTLGIIKIEIIASAKKGRSTRISLPCIPAKELERELSFTLTIK